jgi:hypothetical protein
MNVTGVPHAWLRRHTTGAPIVIFVFWHIASILSDLVWQGSVSVAICEPQPEDSLSATVAAHRPVAPGEAGELRVKGPGVFKEYVLTGHERARLAHDCSCVTPVPPQQSVPERQHNMTGT